MKRLPAGARVLLAALWILVGTAGAGHATCRSSCTEELRACGRTCTGLHGQERQQCRRRCADRSTCTAPGTGIRTLAYVMSECTTDPQGRSSLTQKLLVRRGNCDPVTVMEAATPTPVPDRYGLCRKLGPVRLSYEFVAESNIYQNTYQFAVGVFQALAVLPDASGVVFEVTTQFPRRLPALTPEIPEEGIFFVRADGTGLQRLGPPSRVQSLFGAFRWAASPDGRKVAFIDLGPSCLDCTSPYEAPQVWLLDMASCRKSGSFASTCRRQLTHQPRLPRLPQGDPGIWLPAFLNNRTIGYYAGATGDGTATAFQVHTHGGSPEKELPPITADPAAHVVSQFGVTGRHPTGVVGFFLKTPAENEPNRFVREVFVVDGKNAVQLTTFERFDTSTGGLGGRGLFIRNRLIFLASADPAGENPGTTCQLFSIDKLGGDPHQLTHLPPDGPPPTRYSPSPGNCVFAAPGCGITNISTTIDHRTDTVLFSSTCDPLGGNPFGDQIFAMRADGSGLRQLTNARGMTTDPDGTVHVELAGPFAYP